MGTHSAALSAVSYCPAGTGSRHHYPAAAGLGFLGLGAQPPMAEWGAMIADGMQVIFDQWWIAAVHGAAILIAGMAFNLLGDGLRDIMEPQHD